MSSLLPTDGESARVSGHPADHSLARAIDACQSTKRQCAAVAAVLLGCVRPAAEGHSWAVALIVGAAIPMAVLVLILAVRYAAIRDRATELIADGEDGLAVPAVQVRRRRLLRERNQLGLARCLDDMVWQATTPRARQLRPAVPLFDYRVIADASGDLHSIAALLRTGQSGAAGVARVERLVSHAESPLYGPDAERLQTELEQVRRVLADGRECHDCPDLFPTTIPQQPEEAICPLQT